MENNKIYKAVNRLSILSIILGIIITFSGLGGALVLSIFTGPSVFILLPLFVLIGVFVLISGIRIKKNKDSLYNVKGSLVLIFILSALTLLQSVVRLVSVTKSSSGPLMLPLALVMIVFSGLLFMDSIKLLQSSKKSQI